MSLSITLPIDTMMRDSASNRPRPLGRESAHRFFDAVHFGQAVSLKSKPSLQDFLDPQGDVPARTKTEDVT